MVRAGALGDFVVSLPVIAALIEAGFAVDVVITARFAPLLPRGVARVLDVGGAEFLWFYAGQTPPDGLGPWQLGLAFSAATAEAMRTHGVPEVRLAPALQPGSPASAQFMEMLKSPWLPSSGGAAREFTARHTPLIAVDVAPVPPGTVLLGPGAGASAKRWPLTRWKDVARALRAQGVGSIVAVRGPEEREEHGWGALGVPVESPGLGDTASLAAGAAVWLGPDSGPAHLAAAVGIRVGVVFGPTDATIWAPPGAHVFDWSATPEAVAAWVVAERPEAATPPALGTALKP